MHDGNAEPAAEPGCDGSVGRLLGTHEVESLLGIAAVDDL